MGEKKDTRAIRQDIAIRQDGTITTREQKIAAIQNFTLFSDTFARVVFEDVTACQYVLRILTGDEKLQLSWVKTQFVLSKLVSHDAWLDVLAKSMDGVVYAMEIQNRNNVDHPRRVRFYEAMIDSYFLEKGENYDEIPDVTLVYVCRKDFLGNGVVSWSVEKYQRAKTVSAGVEIEQGSRAKKECEGCLAKKSYEDGLHTRYVNAEIDDGSETARLMRYFLTADPKDESHGALSKRVRFLKCEEKGRDRVCEVTDLFWRSGYAVGEEKGWKAGERRGEKRGERRGMDRGIRLTKQALILQKQGKTQQEIAKELKISQKEVLLMLE